MAQTTKKYQIIQKVSANDTVLLHPETESSVVTYDNTASQLTATNVKAAVDELKTRIDTVQLNVDALDSNVVKGVKGSAESSYRKGQVSISYQNVGAEQAGAVSTHNSSGSAHSDIRSSVTTAQNTADEAKSIAQGRARAVSFDTVSAMATALNSAAKTDYKVGDNLFIKALNVPDYWISKVNNSKSGDYGYFEISPLETQSVDLSGYQTKTDNTLSTTSKTIVGAIDELKGQIATAMSDCDIAATIATNAATEVSELVNGSTPAARATTATSATSADRATSAGKWTTARALGIAVVSGSDASGNDLMGTGSANIDGSADSIVTINLANSGVSAGTYSAVQVNAKGIAIAGGQMIEIGSTGQTTPSASLATGGLFFKEV